ncbi:hypothetical protein GK047_20390 [Paenibacillus sp. SYP-B3998]|uniref:S8 family serine peptidase n=1 Tax=Paenibacillus sp. SYP-B3998 TaxID=2678564 RepID=A0A6G4A3G3_9BACL|nr:S8 family serine peptidase [Paenibacillus sp. SYP-B3998]NEW08361.1 hypothetical protein [Paenibacillus sp. SYP-B3998]
MMHRYFRLKSTLSVALVSSLLLSLNAWQTGAYASEGGQTVPTNSSVTSTVSPAFYEEIVVKLRAQAPVPNKAGTLQSLSFVPELSFGRSFSQFVPRPSASFATNENAAVFERYYSAKVPAGADVQQLLQKLRSSSLVEDAYLSQKPGLPQQTASAPLPNSTPVLSGDDPRYSLQGYAQSAPTGTNSTYAWQFEGGDGKGIKWADVEWNWALNHEDLAAHKMQLLPGSTNDGDGRHGTAVLGVVSAVDNTIGNIGMASKAQPYASSLVRVAGNWSTTEAILSATQVLSAGDVILLEIQVGSNNAWMPIEVQTAEFDAIKYATSLGITVVAAAGNGNVDLDLYKTWDNKYTFNPNNPDFKDSGSILVGAGSSTVPHHRLGFSNQGNRIDAYGYGENVATLDSTSVNSTTGYTDTFNGTSSASPVVVGTIIQLQGIAKAKFGVPYTPAEIRRLLRWLPYNVPTSDPASDRIGSLPNLQEIITNLPTPGNVPNDTSAPTAPTNLVATDTANNAIDLTWNASTDNVGLIGYDVYVDNDPITKLRARNTSASISGLTPGSHTITAKARDGFNNLSAASNSVTVQILNCPAPWNASTAYSVGDIVAYYGVKYQAKWWTQNERPDLKSGPNDVWTVVGPC